MFARLSNADWNYYRVFRITGLTYLRTVNGNQVPLWVTPEPVEAALDTAMTATAAIFTLIPIIVGVGTIGAVRLVVLQVASAPLHT